MSYAWLRSRWTIGIVSVVIVLFAVGSIWYGVSRHNAKPTALPTARVTATPSPTPVPNPISTGAAPKVPLKLPVGYVVHVFASSLGTARDLTYSPGGTLLVSDPADSTVYALPDANHDNVADSDKVVLKAGTNPHGLAFYGGKLYVAETQRVVRYNWDEATLTATLDKVLFTLPANSDHDKRTIIFDSAGHMFVSVGSTCNVCNESNSLSATIIESDADGTSPHIYASGLRNAPFMAFNPMTNEMWATEMGRDYLGDNAPPDEIDIIRSGLNYGWPYCYGAQIHDSNFDPNNTHTCGATQAPIFQIPAHSAPLGLAFIKSNQFPTNQQGSLLVAYHGSWNRSVPTGYKVVLMNVQGNTITAANDFITGFDNNIARPVDLTLDTRGNLYLSDDKAGVVYIIQKQP